MVSGLDGLALAVEHLESLQKGAANAGKRETPPSASPVLKSTAQRPLSLVPPPAATFANSPRVISLEILPAAKSPTSVAAARNPKNKRSDNSLKVPPKPPRRIPGDTNKPLKNLELVYEPRDLSTAAPVSTDEVHRSVRDDDVLCGRGGETNHHSGNIQYRMLVKACQPAYLRAKRRDKPCIAAGIVLAVRKVGGRFLKKDSQNTWKDVGNSRAREKTSQALREGAPELRTSVATSPQGPVPVALLPKMPHQAVIRPYIPAPLPAAALVMGNTEPHAKKQRRSSLEHLAAAASMRPQGPPQTASFHGFSSWAHQSQPQPSFQPAPQPPTLKPKSSEPAQQKQGKGQSVQVQPRSVKVPPANQNALQLQADRVANISGEEDGNSSSSSSSALLSGETAQNTKRGPRIKLLKRRLMKS